MRWLNLPFNISPYAEPRGRSAMMKTTVSLSDVMSDYISRYGLTEMARRFFLERVEQEAASEGWSRATEKDKSSSK